MIPIKSSLIAAGIAFSTAALAGGMHAGGHGHDTPGHSAPTGMGGHHHGPAAWNAPAQAAARPNPVPPRSESLSQGEEIYQQYCAVCHGPAGRGDGPQAAALNPPPPDLRIMGRMHPPGDLAWKIEQGRGAMPAWEGVLSQRQIWDTVNYIQHLAEGR